MPKTTAAEFQKYKKFLLHWQNELGLHDWHIYAFHKRIDDDYAQTSYSTRDRIAEVTLNTVWSNRPPVDAELSECALHEMMHLVTAPLDTEAKARYADEYTLAAAEHAIVVRMTSYIMRITK